MLVKKDDLLLRKERKADIINTNTPLYRQTILLTCDRRKEAIRMRINNIGYNGSYPQTV